MSLENFKADPWKNEKSHPAYKDSVFAIRPAPEFATSEVVLSSMYRAVGFSGFSEKKVIEAGREFQKRASQSGAPPPGGVSNETWTTVIFHALASPKQSNQSTRRVLQMSPLVPDANLYSGSARLAGNPWNPGALIERMIAIGADSETAKGLWAQLFDALSVDGNDDAWARWLQEEFARRKPVTVDSKWSLSPWEQDVGISDEDRSLLTFPSQQFVIDIASVLAAKSTMTRRQWLSLVEAIVRLGSVSHVMWLCGVNTRIWECAVQILNGTTRAPETPAQVRDTIFSSTKHHLNYGSSVLPPIRNVVAGYLAARLGLNFLLWELDPDQLEIPALSTTGDLIRFFKQVEEHSPSLIESGLLTQVQELKDQPDHARTLACKKGIGSNLVEFARYVLGRRQAAESSLRSYDQSYVLNKRGTANSSPWVVSLGPVTLLALVHCCLRQFKGPRSVRYLSKHLEKYGISMSVENVSSSQIGKELRMLGLILDSPDAESGILLVPPFEISKDGAAR